jgi:hypothetical protein
MELELIRTYYPTGTNGKIQYQSRLMMYSIELPWKENLAQLWSRQESNYPPEPLPGIHFKITNHYLPEYLPSFNLVCFDSF